MKRILGVAATLTLLAVFSAPTWSQQAAGPVKVVVKDGKTVTEEAAIPVDPRQRIVIGHSGVGSGFNFGLSVDGQRICCSPQGSIWVNARIDGGQMIYLGQNFDNVKVFQ